MKRLIVSLLFILNLGFATIINVPADYSTIQDGIYAAYNGDTVLVQEGTYFENTIRFFNKNLVVGSLFLTTGIESYITSTVIDGNTSGNSIISFQDGENSANVLIGFTITNGGNSTSQGNGGGISLINASSPTLENLIVSNNQASGGGGIFCGYGSNPILTDILIVNNEGWDGGGLYCESLSSPSLTNVTLIGNTANKGGAIKCNEYSNPTLINVTVSGNMANNGGGLFCNQSSSPNLLNTIFWNNSPEEIYFSGGSSSNSITISYSNIQGGENGIDTNNNGTINWLNGNINAEPLFCNPYSLQFTLAQNSPCIGTGENSVNMGAYGIGCDQPYVHNGPVWHVATTGSDSAGDGQEGNPFATIQTAIDSSSNGDTVLVAAGTYVENLIWPNTNGIKLIGSGQDDCIIDGNQQASVISLWFQGNLGGIIDTTTLISGFTVTNGISDDGGGIRCGNEYGSSGPNPTLKNLKICYNSATRGGGIYCDWGGNPVLKNVIISNNTAIYGGGIRGAGNSTNAGSSPTLINVVITSNSGMGLDLYNSNSVIKNTINYHNGYETIPTFNNLNISYSNIEGGWEGEGNIDANPLFCDPDSGDYTLAENSPCIGTGENGANMGAFGVGCGIINQALNVPADYSTIQTGINAAIDGDTVLVAAGTYVENINYNGKNISVIGEDRETTIIDGNQAGTVVLFQNGGDSTALLSGFTIQNGYNGDGGGVGVWYSDPTITNVKISNNTAQYGGGIYLRESSSKLQNVEISNNTNTTFDAGTASGSGVYSCCYSNLVFNHVTFVNNRIWNSSDFIISNSIFWNDQADTIYFEGSDLPNVTYSNIPESVEISGAGNIDANPLFCNPDSGDYTLAENSPCLGTGENGANMGAFGVGCGPIILAPVISDIDDQQITEDGVLTLVFSATSDINASMSFTATSDTSDVSVTMDSTTLTATPAPDWNGSSLITVIVTDENELSDTTDFTLTVNAVNDSPEEFSVIYPTVSDTFSTHSDNDTLIQFTWGKSNDVDSDVTYNLTIELEFFGNTYTDIHENISDTTLSVSSNSLDPMLNVIAQDEAGFTYYVHASDDEYNVASDVGEFVLSRAALGAVDGYAIPDEFSLHQNYPNPFNPVTTLRYDLPENGHVNIIIYDMLGKQVKTLMDQTQDTGFKSVIWDATNDYGKPVSAGIYLYQIQAGEYMQTKKMVLLK